MKKKGLPRFPNFDEEDALRSQGYDLIAGIDEVGRGALAGPVVASAVILPRGTRLPWFELVRDSKELNSRQRESLFNSINEKAVAVGIGIVPPKIIDAMNILRATKLAMMQAVEKLLRQPSFLIIDRVTLPQCAIPQKGITRGDKLCLSIACASIVAKVTRDRMMEEFDRTYPGYGFAQHKGYGTGSHMSCLRELGPSAIHRLYFAPIRNLIADRTSGPLVSEHSVPFVSFDSEPTASHLSESATSRHSDRVQMKSGRPKKLIQGKLDWGRAISGHTK
jgi:ribonuclease HII